MLKRGGTKRHICHPQLYFELVTTCVSVCDLSTIQTSKYITYLVSYNILIQYLPIHPRLLADVCHIFVYSNSFDQSSYGPLDARDSKEDLATTIKQVFDIESLSMPIK